MYRSTIAFALTALLVGGVSSCKSGHGNAAENTPASGAPSGAVAAETAAPEALRIVAIGDLHGDMPSALEAFQLAGAVDAAGAWIGGDMVVVQLGDQTDRGDDEREILDWFERLKPQAEAAGGALHTLLGNHEVMNAQLDLRYVTEGGFEDFGDIPHDATHPLFAQLPPDRRGRVAAFIPGGPYARRLAEQPSVLQLGDTVFVHGGLEPEFAAIGIDELNESVAAWLRADDVAPDAITSEDGPFWSRDYSHNTTPEACAELSATLDLLGAKRMVVGHTVQEQINSACDEKVWRVDVGLADYYAGETQVLEIIGDQVTPLRLSERE